MAQHRAIPRVFPIIFLNKTTFSDNLLHHVCSFNTEFYAILITLKFFKSLNHKKVLIVSDSQSVLLATNSISFDSSSSLLIFLIEPTLSNLYLQDFKTELI